MELCLLWEPGLGVSSEPCAEAFVCQMSPSVPPAAAPGRAPIAQGLAPVLPRPGSFGLEAVLPIPRAAARLSLAQGAVPPAQKTQNAAKFTEFEVCIGVCRELSVAERNGLETGDPGASPLLHNALPRAQAHFYPPGKEGEGHEDVPELERRKM